MFGIDEMRRDIQELQSKVARLELEATLAEHGLTLMERDIKQLEGNAKKTWKEIQQLNCSHPLSSREFNPESHTLRTDPHYIEKCSRCDKVMSALPGLEAMKKAKAKNLRSQAKALEAK